MKLMTQRTLLGLLGTLLSIPAWASGEHGHGHHGHDEAEHGHHEGHTQISESFARESGVRIETVGPHTLQLSERLYGRIRPNAERVTNVRAPYPGEIAEMKVSIGDRVEKGDVLAQIRSRESLETYALRAPLSGVVTERLRNPGEFTGSEPLLVVQDLSEVWVELLAYPEQSTGLAVGQTVRIKASEPGAERTATLDYIAPQRLPANQGTRLRASLNNEDGLWAPGQRITGEVLVEERNVPLAVRRSALQSFRGSTVVFARVDDTYEVRKLELGERDKDYVEVLDGIAPGTEYVTENSYLIKADILKSGASHAH
ncbi:efflux RND transporter periplasmic adaptor subunit [Marinimicrobium locisalis]|uniref:efflux RND transporter periplasmic adaptor subunit n=1 Tax=Marinimicrobium locisalis TaxID=546022 RepID=UPI0032216C9D